jgi:hypothetical protein
METINDEILPKRSLQYRSPGMKAAGECGKIAFITKFPDDRRDPIHLNHMDDEEEQ